MVTIFSMTINNVLTNVMVNVLADPVVKDVLGLLGGGGHVVPTSHADLGHVGALAADRVDAEETVELVLGAQGGDGDVGLDIGWVHTWRETELLLKHPGPGVLLCL